MRASVIIGAMLPALTGACGPPPDPGALVVVSGRLVAGPVCPVETDPPSPECAPRPVGGARAVIEVEAAGGSLDLGEIAYDTGIRWGRLGRGAGRARFPVRTPPPRPGTGSA